MFKNTKKNELFCIGILTLIGICCCYFTARACFMVENIIVSVAGILLTVTLATATWLGVVGIKDYFGFYHKA